MVIFINYIIKEKKNRGYILFIALALCIALLLFPDVADRGVARGINICTATIIPSLFPFMIAINLLLCADFEKIVAKLIRKPFEKLFHLNANLACAYLIGALAGFPQGAIAVCAVYDKGGCAKEEAEHALTFCNNTGPAFLIGGVGGMLHSTKAAVILFILQTSISVMYAIITRPKKLVPAPETDQPESKINIGAITSAITSSVYPTAVVCSYILTFAFVCEFVTLISVSEPVKALCYSILEISNACSYITQSTGRIYNALLGFSVAFSGISVHMQIHSCVNGRFSTRKYLVAKAVHGIILFLILLFFKIS